MPDRDSVVASKIVDDPTLEALRRDIDAIDDRILELVAERVRKVLEVGKYKRQAGLAIYDPERERRMLERLSAAAPHPLERDTVRRIFERLVDESRTLEQRQTGGR
jgi:chorismate mutase